MNEHNTIDNGATPVAALPTQLQSYIHVSRYARWLDAEGRRESWDETVNRYAQFFYDRFPDTFPKSRVADSIRNLSVMPSMRSLMTAGPALERDEMAGYNCASVAVDHVRAFDEILYVLMCGTGMGFSVERQFIAKLPVVGATVVEGEVHVADAMAPVDHVIKVRDSKKGWASAYRELLSYLYRGEVPKWDVSGVRPAGARLKTFGGRASGPAPLVDLFEFSVATFKGALGRKLNSVECHDLVCKIADIVVVGGVRRSALISLSNLSDERMRGAKSGQWWEDNPQRALANNSAAYTEMPDPLIFMKEWRSLIESRSGERGMLNRVAMKKQAAKNGRRDPNHEFLTNPCVTGDTRLMTTKGHEAIGSLVGKATTVWNGFEWSDVVPFSTGVNSIFEVTLSNSVKLKVTPYHKFIMADGSRIEAKNLTVGGKLAKHEAPRGWALNSGTKEHAIGYSQGFYSGDGTKNNTRSWVYEPKYGVIPRLVGTIREDGDGSRLRKSWIHGNMAPKNYVPFDKIESDPTYINNWVAGLLDADATVIQNPNSSGVQLGSIDEAFLLDVRLLLLSIGVQSKVTKTTRQEGRTFDGYACQQDYRLMIGAVAVSNLLSSGVRFSRLEVSTLGNEPNRDASRFVTVVSVEDLDYTEETFCVTEPKNNSMVIEGVMTSNCGEIILRSAGLCNLTEVVIRADDTISTLMDKVEVATIMGTYQSTLTNFQYVRPVWRKNAEEERLLGVSMTGIMDHPVLSKVSDEAATMLRTLREHAVKVNAEWAAKLGIPASAAITTVKPSGTVSQLVDSASGIHPRYSEYYIRTVRGDKKDPLAQYMRSVGFPAEDDVMKPETTDVFSFPVKAPAHAVMRNDMTAIEQLEHYVQFKNNWSEHMVSITVYVREEEWVRVGAWVYDHFDDVCGVSFLPHSDHSYRQAPYTECTEAEYNAAVAKMPDITNWDGLQAFEKEDFGTGTREWACTSGSCELI